jgi:hypothetical protein
MSVAWRLGSREGAEAHMIYPNPHPRLRQGEYLMCRRCHTTVSPQWLSCPNCGNKLSDLSEAAPGAGVEHVVCEYPPPQIESRMGKARGAGCAFTLLSPLIALAVYIVVTAIGFAVLALPAALVIGALSLIWEALYLRRPHSLGHCSGRLAR